MRVILSILTIVTSLVLAGCNTDDMVPKAPVGNEVKLSRPAQSLYRDPVQPVETASLDNQGAPQRGPQNSLQAQADALAETGQNPTASGPIDSNGMVTSGNQRQMNTNPDAEIQAKPTQVVALQTAAGTIRFLPIIGAPVKSVTPLSRQLGTDARASGLTIKSSSDTSAEHILKGYLSAFNDGQKTTIVYVWDVLDNSGQRLNRIQGQEEVPGKASDAWSSVPDETMQAIASKTIQQYVAWKGAN